MADKKPVKKAKKQTKVPVKASEFSKAKNTNPWILHLREHMNANPGMSLKQAMNEARASYVPKQKK